jgi:hypothetical protein
VGVAAIDAPGGFLFEWQSVFWDIDVACNNEEHSEVAASYIEVNSDVPTLGGISYNSISNGFYNLCKLAQKQSF